MVTVSFKMYEIRLLSSIVFQDTQKRTKDIEKSIYDILIKFKKAMKLRNDKIFIQSLATEYLKTKQLKITTYTKGGK